MSCIFHRWKTVKDTGMTKYQQCEKCNKRIAFTYIKGGYQPIDQYWVETGKWSSMQLPSKKQALWR